MGGELTMPEGYTKTPEGDIMPPLHLLAEDTGQYTEYRIWGTPIDGLLVWDRKDYFDERGDVQELLKTEQLAAVVGRPIEPKQVMRSRNKPRGVFRGIHAEEMDKVVTPDQGVFYVAIVDLRPDSKTFGQYVSFTIDNDDPEKSTRSLFVSNGLGNSFLTMGKEDGPVARYFYAASAGYKTSEGKRSLKWDDKDIKDAVTGKVGIDWPINPTIMSPVDATGNKSLRELFPQKF